MVKTMTKDVFSDWLTQITKCKPTLRSSGLKNQVLMYDECMDLTDGAGFIEKIKKKSGVIYLKLDLCLTFKDGQDSAKNDVMRRFTSDTISIKCCCFRLNSANRPLATLDDFSDHVVICSRRRLWMCNAVFTFCAVSLMSWPYRLLWNSVVVEKELQIVKQITFSVV